MMMQQHVFTIAQTCESAGIQHAVICPGSRSAPLVYAFSSSSITCHSVVDERSAAYMALGMAQQTGKPVVIICTSGTAALNFFPAVAEAYYQHIPLIVLTADRPPELLNQQDGQMIMQKNLYGSHVKGSYELDCYSPGKEDRTETKKLLVRVISESLSGAQGPVHVNIPLKEPLYPASPEWIYNPFQTSIPLKIESGEIEMADLVRLESLWEKASRKLILIGQMPCDALLTGALHELQQKGDTVIVCDILSNQYQYNTAPHFDYLLMRADQQSLFEMEPDLILSLGGPVLSKSLKKWVQQLKPATHIRFNDAGWNVDTYRNVTYSITASASPFLSHLALSTPKPEAGPTRFKLFWEQSDQVITRTIQQYITEPAWTELHAMNYLLSRIPDASNVQIGNSSIIRYVSHLGTVDPSWVMSGNRGTSGIDGCTSTAVGAALVNNRPTFLLTGDIAFLYDQNALWNRLPENLKVIVFNNNGGGIFQLIDGPGRHPDQLDYFTTPHHQDIGALMKAKNIAHIKASDRNELANISASFFNHSEAPAVLEIVFDRTENARAFDAFKHLNL